MNCCITKVFHNVEEVIAAVAVAVEYYNNERPHMSIGMSTPSKASMMQGDRDMKWKSLRQEQYKTKKIWTFPPKKIILCLKSVDFRA